jgi:short subunit dehydrogenase-like uncharacterized protein
MSDRPYDLVIYGASGFVGRQAVRYLSEKINSDKVRWAIAGRSRQSLEAVKAEIAGTESLDVWVADSQDQRAVDAIASKTQVLINTAGPFAKYGTAIVDACVRLKTHYVDITGETPWVKDLIDRYHEQAASDGTRIIPFCGFDSVPSDLGTYLVVHYMNKTLGVSCQSVQGYFQGQGGFNGGTLASGLGLYDSQRSSQVGDPFLLNPPGLRSDPERNLDFPLPHYDSAIGAWVGPFFMAPINTRVVRRSSALYEQWLEPYGSRFSYQEYMKFDGPLGWLMATGMTASLGLVAGAMQLELGRQLLRSVGPQPGEGPSEQTMNQGWFRFELIGQSEAIREIELRSSFSVSRRFA